MYLCDVCHKKKYPIRSHLSYGKIGTCDNCKKSKPCYLCECDKPTKVIIDQTRWPLAKRLVPICRTGKKTFTKIEAEITSKKMKNVGKEVRMYSCAQCKKWHLTSQLERV